MNREIKFRGFSEELKQFVYGFYHEVEAEGVGYSYIFWQGNTTPVRADSIGQFTGQYDKNLKEIFEDDIIGDWTNVDGKMEQSKQTVYFDEMLGQWMLDNSLKQDKTVSYSLFSELNDFEYEIIGNFFENPEILLVTQAIT
jgi:uncharacterized phage protein (TIGR01671 family)